MGLFALQDHISLGWFQCEDEKGKHLGLKLLNPCYQSPIPVVLTRVLKGLYENGKETTRDQGAFEMLVNFSCQKIKDEWSMWTVL